MKKVKIAVLDSGIDKKCDCFKDIILSGRKVFWDNKVIYDNNFSDENGHGTACASTIYREFKNLELVIVKIMNQNGRTNVLTVEEALRYLLNTDVDIINMSFSIPQIVDSELYQICDELVAENKVLVASCDNCRKESYPCFFDNVIGVRGAKLNSINEIWYDPVERVQCVIDNTPTVSMTLNGHYQMLPPNNSLATARVTGIIANIISQNCIEKNNYSQIIQKIFNKEIADFRATKDINNWYVENNDPILLKVYDTIRKDKDLYCCSENICDYELLTSKGCIKYDDVDWLINSVRNKIGTNADFLSMDRYDLLTLGSLTKYLKQY